MLKWPKLESVNNMYVRTSTGIALSNDARKFKSQVAKQVRKQLPKTLPFNNKDVFKLSLHFILKARFFVRDTSNFIKLVEDCIFEELDINDTRNLELECKKSFLKGSDYEFIKATIEKSDFDWDYYNKKSIEESKKSKDSSSDKGEDKEVDVEEKLLNQVNQVIEDNTDEDRDYISKDELEELLLGNSLFIINNGLNLTPKEISKIKSVNDTSQLLKYKKLLNKK